MICEQSTHVLAVEAKTTVRLRYCPSVRVMAAGRRRPLMSHSQEGVVRFCLCTCPLLPKPAVALCISWNASGGRRLDGNGRFAAGAGPEAHRRTQPWHKDAGKGS